MKASPPLALSNPGVSFADFAGDGLTELLVQTPQLTGFYELTADGGWNNFKKFIKRFNLCIKEWNNTFHLRK